MRFINTVIALGIVLVGSLYGQNERASISGIVSDPSGAAVTGANVAARNLATAVETNSVTNGSGNYYISLPPGDYRVTISRAGFSTSVVPKLTLTVAQNAAVPVLWIATKRLSKGHFQWWPTGTEPAQTLRAHQAQLLLAAGNPDADAPPVWRPVNA